MYNPVLLAFDQTFPCCVFFFANEVHVTDREAVCHVSGSEFPLLIYSVSTGRAHMSTCSHPYSKWFEIVQTTSSVSIFTHTWIMLYCATSAVKELLPTHSSQIRIKHTFKIIISIPSWVRARYFISHGDQTLNEALLRMLVMQLLPQLFRGRECKMRWFLAGDLCSGIPTGTCFGQQSFLHTRGG